MAKSLSNLQAQTRTYLDEVTQDDWTDTEVTREINAAYMEVYTAVVNVFEDYYTVKSQTSSVANQQEYSLPTDLYKIRRVEINYNPSDSNSTPRYARPINMDEVLRDLGNTTLGVSVYRNPAYYIRGSIIGFIPYPTVSGSTAITIWYMKTIAELSSSSDEIDIPFPDRYGQLIALKAAATLLRKGQQEEAVARQYILEFEAGLGKMQEELEDRIAHDTQTTIDTVRSNLDFQTMMG